MFLHSAARYLMIGGLLAAIGGWWMKDGLPDPARLRLEELEEPVQKSVRRPPIQTRVNGIDYRIQPRYAYELNAVVVSLHHSDTWWDYVHKASGDYVNIMDLCVAWGDSVRSGAYRDVSFSNNQWECHWSYRSELAMKHFKNTQVSNNHIVTDDPGLAKALRNIHVGDQVRLRGFLVDYTVFNDGRAGGTRVSSETRTDTGNGACEVLYIDGFDKVGSPNLGWRATQWTGLALVLAGVLLWMFLPARLDD